MCSIGSTVDSLLLSRRLLPGGLPLGGLLLGGLLLGGLLLGRLLLHLLLRRLLPSRQLSCPPFVRAADALIRIAYTRVEALSTRHVSEWPNRLSGHWRACAYARHTPSEYAILFRRIRTSEQEKYHTHLVDDMRREKEDRRDMRRSMRDDVPSSSIDSRAAGPIILDRGRGPRARGDTRARRRRPSTASGMPGQSTPGLQEPNPRR